MSEAFKLIQDLDLSSLSETDRQAATIEVRAQLDYITQSGKHDVETLARKVSLLQIWQKLVHLRVLDIARNVKPPFEKPNIGRLYPEASMEELSDHVDQINSTDNSDMLPGSEMVLVRTLQEGDVHGTSLPAGVTVETSLVDAETLVASGLGIIIQRSEVHPDEKVTRSIKAS